MHIPPWVSWHSEVVVFCAVLVMGWCHILAARTNRPAVPIEIPALVVPLLVLGIIVLAQLATGLIEFRGDAFTYLGYFLLCAASITLGFNARQDGTFLGLAVVILTAGIFSAVIFFIQTLDVWVSSEWIHRSIYIRRSGGNIGQPNQLATLLLMSLVSCAYLYEKQKVSATFAMVLVSVLCVAIVGTESRTAYLSFSTIVGWWFLKASNMQCRLLRKHVLVFVACFVLLYMFWPELYAEFYQVTNDVSPGPTKNNVSDNRFLIWPQLLQAVWMHPWWGWGLGAVSEAHNAVVYTYTVSEPYIYAHNIVLDLALGIGIPLTLLFVAVAAVWIERRAIAIRDISTWYCMAMAIPVGVHSMSEFPFAYAYFLFPFMFVLGHLERLLGVPTVLHLSWKPLGIGLCVLTVLFAWSTLEYIAIEEDFRVARAEGLKIGQTQAEYERPKVYLLTQLDALLKASRIEPRPNMPTSEIELARDAALRYPWTAIQFRYALALAMNGKSDEAARQLRVMRAHHGAKHFEQIRQSWIDISRTKYPELAVNIPTD